jgi:rhodanese-related sulfurtransferase
MAEHAQVRITPAQAVAQMQRESAVIIDVREPHDFQKEHIAGAVSLPLDELALAQLPAGKTAILYCGAGKRSCAAAERLIESGYRAVATLEGGIAAWKAEQLPTVSSEAVR